MRAQGGINWAMWNVCGLGTDRRVHDLTAMLKTRRPDVVCLSETFSKHREDGSASPWAGEIAKQGYGVIECPRKGIGGGTAVLFNRRVFVEATEEQELKDARWAEATTVTLRRRDGGPSIRVTAVYIPPLGGTGKGTTLERNADMVKLLLALHAANTDGTPHLIAGDFNATHVMWGDHTVRESPDPRGVRLMQLLLQQRWQYATKGPTRVFNGSESWIDLALAIAKGWHLTAEHRRATSSDHCWVEGSLTPTTQVAPAASTKYAPARVQWDAITDAHREAFGKAVLAEVAARPTGASALEEEAAAWERALHRAAKELPHDESNFVFVDRRFRKAEDELMQASHDWKQGDMESQGRLRQAREAYCKAAKTIAERRSNRNRTQATYTTEAAWRLFDAEAEPHVQPSTICADESPEAQGQPWTSDRQRAEGFLRVFTNKSKGPTPTPETEPPPADLSPVTEAEVQAAIAGHNRGKAADPTGLKAEHAQALPQSVWPYLAAFFTRCLREGRFPRGWKESLTVPVLKPGKRPELATSYRPVALTSMLSRTLERVILHRVSGLLDLPEQQYGFRKGHTQLDALVPLILGISDGFDSRWKKNAKGTHQMHTLAVAVDFTDAFCRVTPTQVLEALPQQIAARYGRLLVDFLVGRSQVVRYGDTVSTSATLDRGTPQGSVLGPVLWLLASKSLITKLEDTLEKHRGLLGCATGIQYHGEFEKRLREAKVAAGSGKLTLNGRDAFGISFWADDGVVWLTGNHDEALLTTGNAVLETITRWAHEADIALSLNKSAAMYFSQAKHKAGNEPWREWKLECKDPGGKPIAIPVTTEARCLYLGVTFDRCLTFAAHCRQAIARARIARGTLAKVIQSLSSFTARAIWEAHCYAPMRYAAEVWLPYTSNCMRAALESEHAEAMRLITGCMRAAGTAAALRAAGALPFADMVQGEAARFVVRTASSYLQESKRAIEAYPIDTGNRHPPKRGLRNVYDSMLRATVLEAARATTGQRSAPEQFWVHRSAPKTERSFHLEPEKTADAKHVRIAWDAEGLPPKPKKGADGEKADNDRRREWLLERLADLTEEDVVAFTDGSSSTARTKDAPTRRPAGRSGAWIAGQKEKPVMARTGWAAGCVSPEPDADPRNEGRWQSPLPEHIHSGTATVGGCSFVAEDYGILNALTKALVESVNARVGTGRRIRKAVVCTDSQSVLRTLARGPADINDPMEEELWVAILALVTKMKEARGNTWTETDGPLVELRYIPAHCGFAPHDAIDKAAGRAAGEGWQQELLQGVRIVNGHQSAKTWWKDEMRFLRRYSTWLSTRERKANPSDRGASWGERRFGYAPHIPIRIPRWASTTINNLRSGICPGMEHYEWVTAQLERRDEHCEIVQAPTCPLCNRPWGKERYLRGRTPKAKGLESTRETSSLLFERAQTATLEDDFDPTKAAPRGTEGSVDHWLACSSARNFRKECFGRETIDPAWLLEDGKVRRFLRYWRMWRETLRTAESGLAADASDDDAIAPPEERQGIDAGGGGPGGKTGEEADDYDDALSGITDAGSECNDEDVGYDRFDEQL